MKILPERYQCEVCHSIYYEKKNAEKCESRGKAPIYPIGCIYQLGLDTYKGITFAIADNEIVHHANVGRSWACRDTSYGDSLWDQTCSGTSLTLNLYTAVQDFESPHFKRMVDYLKEREVPITIWDGEKAVPYKEPK